MKYISTIVFLLWSVLYILHDLKFIELFDMDIIPVPIVIILYIGILTSSKKFMNWI